MLTAHQPTRRKEKSLIKFKSAKGVQNLLSLMGKIRNIFAVDVGRYKKNASDQRVAFNKAKLIWDGAAHQLLPAWNSRLLPLYGLMTLTWRCPHEQF